MKDDAGTPLFDEAKLSTGIDPQLGDRPSVAGEGQDSGGKTAETGRGSRRARRARRIPDPSPPSGQIPATQPPDQE
ncbi:hypothetical protein [Paraoerskovia marina]|uniref:hypothetical protein n=1 Tax=Paraoerskovia marina TaxID=545619 RepID=UPI0004929858|nr:hypothetical protein [Paraoerskovia marina]